MSRDLESTQPLVQFQDKDSEDDDELLDVGQDSGPKKPAQQPFISSPPRAEPRMTIVKSEPPQGTEFKRSTIIILVAVAVVAVAVAFLALILAAVVLNRPTSSSSNLSPSSAGDKSSTPIATTSAPIVPPTLVPNSNCGNGQWNKVVSFDMSDPNQQCPKGWRGYDTPVRSCGRPVTSIASCPSVFFSTGGYRYTKVCGRAVGYQKGSPDAFGSADSAEPDLETINGIYVDGLSLTHGNPRKHIWTFAAGVYEYGQGAYNDHNCPCDRGLPPPPFIANNRYFCETGDDNPGINLHRFYADDPLWDGDDCTPGPNSTCCTFNNPPWFSIQLDASTTDDIEARICGDQSTNDEDTPIALLEIFVQ